MRAPNHDSAARIAAAATGIGSIVGVANDAATTSSGANIRPGSGRADVRAESAIQWRYRVPSSIVRSSFPGPTPRRGPWEHR